MKKYFDVTLPIHDGMIVYPGDLEVRIKKTHTIERDGYSWSSISSGTHIGTHIDAPCHFVKGGATMDDFPIDLMVGEVEVVEISNDMVTAAELSAKKIRDWNAVFFKTKNQKLWPREKEEGFIRDYVSLTKDAAEFLAEKRTRLVGIDYRSIEGFDVHDYPVHMVLLGHGAYIIEGLFLNEVPAGRHKLYCFPLKLASADGGPARVIIQTI
jgi:arylformamidase